MYGLESPDKLIDFMAKSMRQREEQKHIDAILINGDFVKHGVAQNTQESSTIKQTWVKLKQSIKANMDIVRKNFPKTDLLPTIGNNDVIVHDNVPCTDEVANKYYSELFEIWFP